jgi:type I restriction enzyme S subunit
LGDVCQIQRGGSPRPISNYITNSSDGVNWIKIGDVAEGAKYIYSTAEKISADGTRYSREVYPGDFLLSNSMSFGRPYILQTSGCIHDGWLVLRYDAELLTEDYLYHVLSSDFVYAQFSRMAVGAVVKNLNSEVVKQVVIPLPSLSEQKHIATLLDNAELLRAKRRETLRLLQSFAQSTFDDLFGDPIINPKGWDVQPLNKLADRIQIGPFGSQLHEEDYVDNGIPLINPTHIKGGKILTDSSLTVPGDKYKQLSQYHLSIGDLILGRRGEMGRCAVISQKEHGWLCGTGSLFVRPNASMLNSTYLCFVVSSNSMRRYLENVAQGVTMSNLNKDIVGSMPVPLPPLALQARFVNCLAQVEALTMTLDQSHGQLNALFESLQDRAFRGDL